MSVDSKYIEFFLNSNSSVVELQCIELSHPNFSQTHRVVRNNLSGATVTHEDGLDYEYAYYPLSVRFSSSREDLDFGVEIEFGDLEGNLQDEMDTIWAADGFTVKPTCVVRHYRSDDLSEPIFGPLNLVVEELAFNYQGAQFDAVAPFKNLSSTGRIYNLNDFKMMRGFT